MKEGLTEAATNLQKKIHSLLKSILKDKKDKSLKKKVLEQIEIMYHRYGFGTIFPDDAKERVKEGLARSV